MYLHVYAPLFLYSAKSFSNPGIQRKLIFCDADGYSVLDIERESKNRRERQRIMNMHQLKLELAELIKISDLIEDEEKMKRFTEVDIFTLWHSYTCNSCKTFCMVECTSIKIFIGIAEGPAGLAITALCIHVHKMYIHAWTPYHELDLYDLYTLDSYTS